MPRKTGNFDCEYCGKRFTLPGNLQLHVKGVHLKETHECTICNKSFTQSGSLGRHIQSVHNGERFKCDFCENVYTEKGALKYHMRKHLGGNRSLEMRFMWYNIHKEMHLQNTSNIIGH